MRVILLAATAMTLLSVQVFAASTDEQGFPEPEPEQEQKEQGFPEPTVEKVTRVTASGVRVFVYTYQSVDLKCKALELPTIKVTKKPANGRVIDIEENAYPNFDDPNPRVKCNKTPAEALKVFYQSARGFTGTDYFSYMITYYNGNTEEYAVKVIVR